MGLGRYVLEAERVDGAAPALLFTENETNLARLFGAPNPQPYVKDAFHRAVIDGEAGAVNPAREGTKAALHYVLTVPAGGERVVRLRLRQADRAGTPAFGAAFERTFASRIEEADEFYAERTPAAATADERRVLRQGYAGLLWSKQFYHYVQAHWIEGDPAQPAPPARPRRGPQRRVAARLQPRHHLDAGQVGVSLVRGLGPGLPHDPVRQGRSPLRQGAAPAPAARVVHAPERPDPGLRVRLRRREPAGARLGLLAGLQDDRRQGPARPPVPRARVPEAAAQLHLVGEPEGSRGTQPVRRRLPRARQHRRLRPLAAAAHRRAPRAGRWHGVDGVLLQHDAQHGAGARERGSRPTRMSPPSSSSTSSPSPTRSTTWVAQGCGPTTTASTTTSSTSTASTARSESARSWASCR